MRARSRYHIALLMTAVLVHGHEIHAAKKKHFSQTGYASYYGSKFHGATTANGEIYNMHKFTAAHRTLPFGTMVRVTRLDNGNEVVVRINDRGPFVKGRIIDLSYAAAEKLEMIRAGVAKVRIEIVK